MEYVDGENLHSLLRRIGRLPPDKAVEIARKLCAGLAAAHDKGVLHRDLKPANVMIDGRGQVLIADFGLAALAGQLDGTNVREGTPAYMAPEQLAGKEASVRSDLYALGLVLHEMFTGKRPFEDGSERITPANVTSGVKDIDPLVERVIVRCLNVDPRNRPASALAVAAALPGGDPLAAALAAGDTPTPGMVAASGDTEGFSVRAAVIWLALILMGLVATVVLGARVNVLRQTPFENSPEVLAKKARDLMQSFGYAAPPADRAYGFRIDLDYEEYAERRENVAAIRDRLAKGYPPPIEFWYRQSPQPLASFTFFSDGQIAPFDPPPEDSEMIGLNLDPEGRLVQLDAVPPQLEEKPESSRAPDWPVLFGAAGLDTARFASAEPRWLSLSGFDARAAWTGTDAQSPEIPLRVEAASWHGRPVFFRVIGPWSRPERTKPSETSAGNIGVSVILAVCLAAVLLAWRNFRAGRGDLRGASRLAAFVFGVEMLKWLCTAHHVSTVGEFFLLLGGVSWAAFMAGFIWTFYLALEPYVRRRWPQSMITWSRVLGGEFRDPLVGGHLLAGIALGLGLLLCTLLPMLALQNYDSYDFNSAMLNSLMGARQMAGTALSCLIAGFGSGLGAVLMIFLLRVVLRRQWLMATVFIALSVGLGAVSPSGHPAITALFGALWASVLLADLLRFGLLPVVVMFFVTQFVLDSPLTTDLSAWYAGGTVFPVAIILALTAYAFHTAVAGRPLFKAGFLESD
jgi:serine/threonine-protein kinase